MLVGVSYCGFMLFFKYNGILVVVGHDRVRLCFVFCVLCFVFCVLCVVYVILSTTNKQTSYNTDDV